MKHPKQSIPLALIFLTIFAIAGFWLISQEDRIQQEVDQPHEMSQAISIEVQDETEESELYQYELRYPQTGVQSLDSAITSYVQSQKEQLLKLSVEQSDIAGQFAYYLNIDHQVEVVNQQYVSVLLVVSDYFGGAHGNTSYKSFLANAKTGELLSLSDLFESNSEYLSFLSLESQAQLDELQFTETEWLANGTAPEQENFQHILLTDSGMTIYFPPYQVAAYAAGPQEVRFSWDELQPYVSSSFQQSIQPLLTQ